MAVQTRSLLKTWFETLDKPTQQQFWDWLDSYFHKNDSIPQSAVDGLVAALSDLPTSGQLDIVDALPPTLLNVSGSGTYEVPAGKILQYIVCEATVDASCDIGTSAGGTQLISASLKANTPQTFRFEQYTKNATTIHFTGTYTALIWIR